MERISVVLRRLKLDPNNLRAARNQPAAEFDAPTPSRMEAEDEQGRAPGSDGAKLATGEEAGASYGKGPGHKAPASPDLGGQKTRRDVKPRLQLVAVNDKIETSIGMRGIRPRGFPASLPRSPMLVIVGGSDQWICPSCGISAAPMLSPTGLRLSRRMSQVLDRPAAAAPA